MLAIIFSGWSRYLAKACAFSLNKPNPTFSFAYKHNNRFATSVITTFPSYKKLLNVYEQYSQFMEYI